jgi:hypothetical protein
MGPANCRGLLKFAMSSIAACALDASIPGRRRRRSVWFSWSPPLETGTIGRNFGASNCQLHLSAKIQKTLLDFRALAGGGFWGGFRGVRPASARYSDTGARRPPRSGVLQARSGSITPEREEHDLSWDTMLHMNVANAAYGNPERGRCPGRGPGLDRSDGGAIKRRLRCRQPSPSLSRRRWRC